MKKLTILLFIVVFALSGCSNEGLSNRVFESEELGISFVIPESISGCEEKIITSNSEEMPGVEGFVANGTSVDIVCDDYNLSIEARSKDFNCYEGCMAQEYPSTEDVQRFGGKFYTYNDLDIRVAGDVWGYGGEHFMISAYYPVNDEKYDTFRVTMKLKDVPEYSNYNPTNFEGLDYRAYVDEYYPQLVLDKNLPDSELKVVNEFEALIDSVSTL